MAKRRTKTTTKSKNVLRGIATLLAGVMVLGAVGVFSSWVTGWTITGEPNMSKWQQSDSKDKGNTTPRTVAISNNGTKMQDGVEYDMPTGFAFLSAEAGSKTEEYAAGGEITLSASLSNEYINGRYDWTTTFKNPESEWAKGKTPDYYVKLEPIDGGRQVKVKYLAKFSEQIILTATLQGTESSDSCTIDCLNAYTLSDVSCEITDFTNEFSIEMSLAWGEGTVKGNFEFVSVNIIPTESFYTAFKNYLNFDVQENIFNPRGSDSGYKVHVNYDYISIGGPDFEYSSLIKGFDDYDQDHKDAIYYAWWQAYRDLPRNNNNNIQLGLIINYTYSGVIVSDFSESFISGFLTGASCGIGVSPSVTLNKNVTF